MEVKVDLENVAQREVVSRTKGKHASAEKNVTQGVERERRPEVKISDSFAIEMRALRDSQRQVRRDLQEVEKAQRLFDKIEPLLLRMRELAVEVASQPDALDLEDREKLNSGFENIREHVFRIAERIELPDSEILELGLTLPEPPGPFVSALPPPTLPQDPLPSILGTAQDQIQSLTGSREALARSDSAIAGVRRLTEVLEVVESRLEEKIEALGIAIEDQRAEKRERIGADEARERADMTRDQMIQHARRARRAHANISIQSALDLLKE